MSAIVPNPEEMRNFAASTEAGPVVMINLLKFKAEADGGGSGRDAYQRYGDAAQKLVEARGGRLIWAGRPDQVLIGDAADKWDLVALVEYPSRRAFIEMVSSAEYQQIHVERERGLESTVLIACKTGR